MKLKLISGPQIEPITLEEAKNYLKVDTTDDDSLIQMLISSAREFVENETGRRMITQVWEMILDDAEEEIMIPFSPLQSITKIETIDDDGNKTVFSSSNYWVDTSHSQGRVKLKEGVTWPDHRGFASIIITFVCGYGNNASDVPSQLKQLILQVLAQFYEGREPQDFPEGIYDMMKPYKDLRI